MTDSIAKLLAQARRELRQTAAGTTTDPAAVIAEVLGKNELHKFTWDEDDYFLATAILTALHEAGYKLAGPDEVVVPRPQVETIANMTASGPHPSAQDGMSSALAALDRTRDIARAMLEAHSPAHIDTLHEEVLHETGGGQGESDEASHE